jgi:hypothetical protein
LSFGSRLTPGLTGHSRRSANVPSMTSDRQQSADRTEEGEESRFGYFLLQTRHDPARSGGLLRATLEDLTTGVKWTFASGRDLIRFLDPALLGDERWAPPSSTPPADPPSSPDRG